MSENKTKNLEMYTCKITEQIVKEKKERVFLYFLAFRIGSPADMHPIFQRKKGMLIAGIVKPKEDTKKKDSCQPLQPKTKKVKASQYIDVYIYILSIDFFFLFYFDFSINALLMKATLKVTAEYKLDIKQGAKKKVIVIVYVIYVFRCKPTSKQNENINIYKFTVTRK